jgi:hypothetical protein
MTFWAASASFQRFGSSAFPFSSARRRCAASQSKMPPQQPDRLLGGFREVLDLGAHDFEGCMCRRGSGVIRAAAHGVNKGSA